MHKSMVNGDYGQYGEDRLPETLKKADQYRQDMIQRLERKNIPKPQQNKSNSLDRSIGTPQVHILTEKKQPIKKLSCYETTQQRFDDQLESSFGKQQQKVIQKHIGSINFTVTKNEHN